MTTFSFGVQIVTPVVPPLDKEYCTKMSLDYMQMQIGELWGGAALRISSEGLSHPHCSDGTDSRPPP